MPNYYRTCAKGTVRTFLDILVSNTNYYGNEQENHSWARGFIPQRIDHIDLQFRQEFQADERRKRKLINANVNWLMQTKT